MSSPAEQAVLQHALARHYLTPVQAQEVVRLRTRSDGRSMELLALLRQHLRPEQLADLSAVYQAARSRMASGRRGRSSAEIPVPDLEASARARAVEAYRAAQQVTRGFSPHADLEFEHLGELGRGGMGVVYRVCDRRLGREAALKVLHEQGDPHADRRFAREVQITASLQHPSIPPIYEAGVDGQGRPFMLMRVIEGQPLSERIAAEHRGPAPVRELHDLLEALVKVGEAVAYAHSQGLVTGT